MGERKKKKKKLKREASIVAAGVLVSFKSGVPGKLKLLYVRASNVSRRIIRSVSCLICGSVGTPIPSVSCGRSVVCCYPMHGIIWYQELGAANANNDSQSALFFPRFLWLCFPSLAEFLLCFLWSMEYGGVCCSVD